LFQNAEIYKLTSEQYQEAATKAEEWIKWGAFFVLFSSSSCIS